MVSSFHLKHGCDTIRVRKKSSFSKRTHDIQDAFAAPTASLKCTMPQWEDDSQSQYWLLLQEESISVEVCVDTFKENIRLSNATKSNCYDSRVMLWDVAAAAWRHTQQDKPRPSRRLRPQPSTAALRTRREKYSTNSLSRDKKRGQNETSECPGFESSTMKTTRTTTADWTMRHQEGAKTVISTKVATSKWFGDRLFLTLFSFFFFFNGGEWWRAAGGSQSELL